MCLFNFYQKKGSLIKIMKSKFYALYFCLDAKVPKNQD